MLPGSFGEGARKAEFPRRRSSPVITLPDDDPPADAAVLIGIQQEVAIEDVQVEDRTEDPGPGFEAGDLGAAEKPIDRGAGGIVVPDLPKETAPRNALGQEVARGENQRLRLAVSARVR